MPRASSAPCVSTRQIALGIALGQGKTGRITQAGFGAGVANQQYPAPAGLIGQGRRKWFTESRKSHGPQGWGKEQ